MICKAFYNPKYQLIKDGEVEHSVPYCTYRHKTESQDEIKKGQFLGCEKGVVFDLKARGEKFR